jgi:hypothetical protein
MTLCRPLPYLLQVAPLERGRRHPRKGYDHLPRTRSGRRRDIRPAERVSFVTSGPVRPSPPLFHHPNHCSVIPVPGVVGARDDGTPPHLPLCILQPSVSPTLELTYGRRPNKKLLHHHPRGRFWTGTGLVTTPARSEILQDNHQLCDTVRHVAICSTRAMRCDCKTASPSPVKGGGGPLVVGERRIAAHSHISAYIHDIVTSPQSNLRDLRLPLLSRLACSSLSTSTMVQRNTAPRAHPCWTYGPRPELG